MRSDAGAKEKICDALTYLMKRKEYARIKVKELIQEADVNPSSYYYHFGAIKDVVDSMIDYFEGIFSVENLGSMNEESVLNAYRRIYERYDWFLCLYHSQFRMELISRIIERFTLSAESYLCAFQGKDQIFRLAKGDYYKYCKVNVYSSVGLIIAWAENDFDDSPEDVAKEALNMLLLQSGEIISKDESERFRKLPRVSLLEVDKYF